MFTFKKPKKNRGQQRRRIGDEDDNSDNEDNGGGGGEHVAQKVLLKQIPLVRSAILPTNKVRT